MFIFGFLLLVFKVDGHCERIQAVPQNIRSYYRLSTFYRKYTSSFGIPVLGSHRVSDAALYRACHVLRFLMSDRRDIREAMKNNKGRVAIMATNEVTRNIPEHAFLPDWWNQRARGLGGTLAIPVSTGAEENVLCLPQDRYREDIFLHEFSHGIHLISANTVIRGFDNRLNSLFNSARQRGLWRNTYADDTKQEYWAEGVQSYFNVESTGPVGGDGIHNNIDTRDKLRNYDPNLYNLIKEVFPCGNWIVDRCDKNKQIDWSTIRMDCDGNGNGKPNPTSGPITGGCEDENNYCSSWASSGECQKNPEYMNVSCKNSCNKCPTVTAKPTTQKPTTQKPTTQKPNTQAPSGCKDDNEHCDYWSKNGHCESSKDYMNENCKKSCDKCPTVTAKPITNTPPPPPSDCEDINSECTVWAKAGLCVNKAYMHKNCKKSCDVCDGDKSCEDENENCKRWSQSGECSKNPDYMHESCKKSCKKCQKTNNTNMASARMMPFDKPVPVLPKN